MVFSSMFFLWFFLPVVVVGYYAIPRAFRNYVLLIASLFFYAWGEPKYICLMICSIIINYIFGYLVDRTSMKRVFLAIDILFNIVLLGYYKYFNFIVKSINRILECDIQSKDIILPIGISFFTFQAMSYVIDVYKGEHKAKRNIFDVALYIAFFPQLIAGPIVNFKDIKEQIIQREESVVLFARGVRRFLYGLGKKVILANTLAEVVDHISELPIHDVNSGLAIIFTLCYTLQIYYDFSGYSDMAIGLAGMFGFSLKENFNYPYMATSIGDFWRRWHISLGAWFREYVYIPFGGNRKGMLKTYFNLLVVFFLTGLWHGASWNFVFWGLYHGFFSIVERLGWISVIKKNHILERVYTIIVVAFGWIFFYFESIHTGLRYAIRILCPWKYWNSMISLSGLITHRAWMIIGIALFGCGIIQGVIKNSKVGEILENSIFEILYCFGIAILSFALLASNTYNPFIYFRF